MEGDSSEVLEGFLCPICLEDLTSITQLQAHFEEQHASEDKDVVQSLKGFLSKAKKKLLNEDEPDNVTPREFDGSGLEYEPNNPWNWDPPPLGPSRSHTSLFKKIRSARIDSFVAETNKLLIRLDKLLRDIPNDPVKRKAHERSIVMWAEDKDVPLCPFCARTFNLARRRHHCRLCGGIMCDECSEFLTFDYAKKLVSPVHQGNVNQMTTVATTSSSSSSSGGPLMTSFLAGISGLRRSGSQGSLNSLLSVMDSMTNEQHFRICRHCMMRLQARDNQVEQRTSKPTLSLYYEKLMEYRSLLERLLPQYIQMAESLNAGETTYNLQDAEELRMKILKTGDNLNSMTQKIRNLGIGSQDVPDGAASSTPLGSRQELLQKRIFSTSSGFLKDNILSLPKLPTFQELKETQERRRLEAEARLAAEKEAMRQAEERASEILRRRDKESKDSPRTTPNRSSSSNTPSRSSSSTPVSFSTSRKKQSDEVVVDTGWGPNLSPPCVTETDDPMIQQMNNLRNYIRQAREANRYDAVATLEANLKELQGEYKKQQRLMNP
ncbi:rabenosyn-5-like [Penaeus chinensis]|uniref:rabenosyn-5-like n=1 Tax=Penaeus chinensis TaxID=139456 RepID=UPI001FB7065B|nr:rabenosyn-5-like [Penaeus chinensis]